MADRADRAAGRPDRSSIYSDIFTNFNAHPNTGALLVRTDVESVKRALRNLMLTDKGERPFNTEFGTNIKSILFEPASDVIKRQLESLIREAIKNYEKRAIVESVNVTLSNGEDTYVIDIYFRIINSPVVSNLSVKLDRIR